MRNLLNIKHAAYQLNPALPLTAQAWDTATDSIVCAFGPAAGRDVIELRRVQDLGARAQNEHALIASWDAPSPLPDLAVDRIVSLHHFGHSETTCLVLAGGDIVVIRSQPVQGQDKIEIVGSVDAGIKAAAWSPDEELLAVATGADTLIFMTADFDSVANVSFDPDDAKLSKHVDVGWGKKETQFQGKRAKAMRDPTMPEHVDEGIISHNDKGDAVISWRGDGAYVAVNTIENKSRRMIRVFTREGNLDSVTEPVDGLESALSWRPAGNLLAGIQRKDEDVKVVFFERNGLRHGQFSLRLSREEAATWGSHIDLQWNSDSSVLAVRYCDRTQFWTMSNYHYYLKQEERFECIPSRHPNLTWHPEQPLRLTIAPPGEEHVSAGTSLRVLEYIFTVSKGSTIAPHDLGTVAVIDGSRWNFSLLHASLLIIQLQLI
jgi:elongator complex protein 1